MLNSKFYLIMFGNSYSKRQKVNPYESSLPIPILCASKKVGNRNSLDVTQYLANKPRTPQTGVEVTMNDLSFCLRRGFSIPDSGCQLSAFDRSNPLQVMRAASDFASYIDNGSKSLDNYNKSE